MPGCIVNLSAPSRRQAGPDDEGLICGAFNFQRASPKRIFGHSHRSEYEVTAMSRATAIIRRLFMIIMVQKFKLFSNQ